jgi:hypothetical protein
MTRDSAVFVKVVIALIALATLAVCVFGLPGLLAKDAAKTPDRAYLAYLFLAYAYFMSFLFCFALYHTFTLLPCLGRPEAFSEVSVRALRQIKYSAVTISASMVAGIVTLMVLSSGKGEDITGIVAPALLITFVSSVAAISTAVVQKHIERAIGINKAV